MSDSAALILVETILAQLEQALAQLEVAEAAAMHINLAHLGRDGEAIEQLLDVATHETASSLAFALQDIRAYLARLTVRSNYAIFTAAEFERIIAEGWSTSLVKELSTFHSDQSLPQLSALIKQLLNEWGGLPQPIVDFSRKAVPDERIALPSNGCLDRRRIDE